MSPGCGLKGSVATRAVVDSQLDILRRICDRGLSYGVEQEHTHVVDLFQHLKDEVQRLRTMLGLDDECQLLAAHKGKAAEVSGLE